MVPVLEQTSFWKGRGRPITEQGSSQSDGVKSWVWPWGASASQRWCTGSEMKPAGQATCPQALWLPDSDSPGCHGVVAGGGRGEGVTDRKRTAMSLTPLGWKQFFQIL